MKLERFVLATVAAILLFPTLAAAQVYSPAVEITPILGYRWDGQLSADNSDLFDEDVEIDSGASYGLLIDVPLSRHAQIEIMADRQSSQFSSGVLFPDNGLARDVDLTYYHVGFLWQWTPNNLRPFVVGSLGFTDIRPEGASSENRFSGSIGGGLKVDLSRHVGFRVEGRGFWTDTGGNQWDDCKNGSCDCHDDWDCSIDLFQSELRVGVMFSF